jgi:hypothetical protein
MNKSLHLQIPVPCHEKWDDMSPADRGKYCVSCQKTVVDFSMMTDRQVLDYFKNANENTCGRFNADQLNRNLAVPAEKKLEWFKYFLQTLIPVILITGKSYAQGTVKKKAAICTAPVKYVPDDLVKEQIAVEESISGKVVDNYGQPLAGALILIKGRMNGVQADQYGRFKINSIGELPMRLIVSQVGFETVELKVDDKLGHRSVTIVLSETIMGDVYRVPVRKHKPVKVYQIEGKVTNGKGEPLESASIYINTTKVGMTADKDGKFEFNTTHKLPLKITVSYVGYEPRELTVDARAGECPLDIVLKETQMEEVVVSALSGTIGQVSITGTTTSVPDSSTTLGSNILICGVKSTVIQNIKDRIADSFKMPLMKIYPNPLRASSFFTIELSNRKNGNYSVLVTEMNGRLLQMDQFNVDSKMEQKQIQFKQPMTPGSYVVTIFDSNSKRLSSKKLIVIE